MTATNGKGTGREGAEMEAGTPDSTVGKTRSSFWRRVTAPKLCDCGESRGIWEERGSPVRHGEVRIEFPAAT